VHDSQGVRLYGRGRDVEEIDSAASFDASSCTWRVLGPAGDVRRTDERGLILPALKKAETPQSPTDMLPLLACRPSALFAQGHPCYSFQ
jgi:hypothetical protein